MTTRKPKKTNGEPTVRDKLGVAFLQAFEADFATHGVSVIEKLREKSPEKYVEIGAKLIAAVEQPASSGDYSRCKSIEEIGRLLLQQVDVPDDAITDDMVAAAIEANQDFIVRLKQIGQGH